MSDDIPTAADETLFDDSEYQDSSYTQRQQAERLFDKLEAACEGESQMPTRILDVGCGDGEVTRALAARFPTAEILAIDESEALIEEARVETDSPQISYRATPFESLGMDESFDVIFANTSFHWIDDQNALYKKVELLLQPGGVVAVHQGHIDCYRELREAAETAAEDVGEFYAVADFIYPLQYHTTGSLKAQLSARDLQFEELEVWEAPQEDTLVEDFIEAGLLPYRERISDENEDEFIEAFRDRANALDTITMSRLYFTARKV